MFLWSSCINSICTWAKTAHPPWPAPRDDPLHPLIPLVFCWRWSACLKKGRSCPEPSQGLVCSHLGSMVWDSWTASAQNQYGFMNHLTLSTPHRHCLQTADPLKQPKTDMLPSHPGSGLTCKSYGFPALTKKLSKILVCAKWTFSSKNPCSSSKRFGLRRAKDKYF